MKVAHAKAGGNKKRSEALKGRGSRSEKLRYLCEDGDASACYSLGVMYRKGKGVIRNKSTARRYFEKACEQEYSNSCVLKSR
jgi:TPR repeat protein